MCRWRRLSPSHSRGSGSWLAPATGAAGQRPATSNQPRPQRDKCGMHHAPSRAVGLRARCEAQRAVSSKARQLLAHPVALVAQLVLDLGKQGLLGGVRARTAGGRGLRGCCAGHVPPGSGRVTCGAGQSPQSGLIYGAGETTRHLKSATDQRELASSHTAPWRTSARTDRGTVGAGLMYTTKVFNAKTASAFQPESKDKRELARFRSAHPEPLSWNRTSAVGFFPGPPPHRPSAPLPYRW